MTDPFRSAAYRIALVYSGAFVLATLLLGLLVYLAAHASLVRQLDAQIESTALDLRTRYADDGRQDLIESIRAREQLRSVDELGFALFGADGRRIAGKMNTGRPPLGWSDITFVDPEEGSDPARALALNLPDGTRLVVAADREPLEAIDQRILIIFGIASLAILLMGILGGLLLGAYLRGRIGRIGRTAETIVSGDLSSRMPVGPRGDEFDELARTLNRMLDQIEQLMDNLRQVSNDVAHDLRTPLTSLHNQLDRALSDPSDREENLRIALERSDELLVLFGAILRISEVEQGRVRRSFAKVDLAKLVGDLCESYAPAIEDSGRSLSYQCQSDFTIEGDRGLIAQMLVNLLDNALRHTPPGAHISVTLAAEETGMIEISDNGPGIPEADRDRVLQRFVRLESSRTTPGHGLGLNMVSAIARLHDWTLEIGDNAPGLRVRIYLDKLD